jgi:hypothetical protein
MTAPEILRLVVTLRAKKCKNSSFALHYDQIRFRFRTAKTQSGHEPDRNPAAQQAPPKCAILSIEGTGVAERNVVIQNDSGLPQGLADRSAAG